MDKAQPTASKIAEAGGSAEALALDVSNNASVQAALDAVTVKHGRLDVLINNAGVNPEFAAGSTPTTLSVELMQTVYEANVFGPLRVILAARPLLAKGTDARIVNVSSTLGSLGALSDPENPYYAINTPAYNSSKTALNALTVAYAKALAADGVAVISICPGWVKTDIGTEAAFSTVEEGVEIIVKMASVAKPPTGTFVDKAGPVAW